MKLRLLPLISLLSACTIESELFEIGSPEDIRTTCEQGSMETFEFLVYFAQTEPGCDWDNNGNLPPEEGVITAREEQLIEVPIPTDVVFCDLDLDFNPTSETQVIEYDDDFFLSLNQVVLLASDATQVNAFEEQDNMPLYDWEQLVGQTIDFGEVPPFCLGQDEGDSVCDIPPDETPGPVTLQLEQNLIDRLSFQIFEQNRFDVSFVTIGDNDAEKDCSHKAYQFLVTMPYTPVPTDEET
jgi:hypothetical protein